MTKSKGSKRKKNYKLRRRMKRTVAALTMVMAIVVAAIPVENFGTMRAAEETVELGQKSREYLFNNAEPNDGLRAELIKYDKEKYETKYGIKSDDTESDDTNDITKEVQHIIDGRFIKAYKINILATGSNSYDAVITNSIFGAPIENFDIYENEFYDYVQMDPNYLRAVYEKFDEEEYTWTYREEEGEGKSFILYTTPVVDESGEDMTIDTVGGVKLILLDSPQMIIQSPASGKLNPDRLKSSGNPYNDVITIDSMRTDIRKYIPETMRLHEESIDTYNKQMLEQIDILEGLKEKENTGITPVEVRQWNGAIAEIKKLQNNKNSKLTFTRTFAQLRGTDVDTDSDDRYGDNQLPDIVDYVICNRIFNEDGNNLSSYKLDHLRDVDGESVRVPQNVSGTAMAKDDEHGYLAAGKARIVGIASDAFNPAKKTPSTRGQVKNITIPKSVQFIGARAFAGSDGLETVVLNKENCEIIGDEAFSNCTYLNRFEFTGEGEYFKTIGCRAFYNTRLTEISFPKELESIGAGCFYLSDYIQKVSMVGLKNGELKIEPYAFFGCYALTEVEFTDDTTFFRIGEAAFALPGVRITNFPQMTEFSFPLNMNRLACSDNKIGNTNQTDPDDHNDYILAGRNQLNYVKLPGMLGHTSYVTKEDEKRVPDNTFAGCINLECVEFPEGACYATYDSEKLFRDVLNRQFYVRGPETTDDIREKASPRKLTWKAKVGYKLDSGEDGVVPYVFWGQDGKEHIEIGAGPAGERDSYIAEITALTETTAALTGYRKGDELTENDPPLAVMIPPNVGQYKITELWEGCFNDVKDKLYKVIISDNTVETIQARALKDCKELVWVELGDSVNYIGEDAFAGCEKLENVVFSQTQTKNYGDEESYWEGAVTIENNAFHTGSEYLTFHGAIHSGYAPFELAMSAEGKDMLRGTNGICYKSDAPTNFTVMRNEATGESTLIDYPHYEEIDVINEDLVKKWGEEKWGEEFGKYSITDKFEELEGLSGGSQYGSDAYKSTEKEIVLNTIDMSLPSGIDSIDSKAYYTNAQNANNLKYLDLWYKPVNVEKTVDGDIVTVETGIDRKTGMLTEKRQVINQNGKGVTDIKALYSTFEEDATTDVTSTGVKAAPGLYSGYFDEYTENAAKGIIGKTYDKHDYVENKDRGNDYLTRIDLLDVTKLPDYAFDSCENLTNVWLGNKLAEVGRLPFRDCKSLTDVIFTNGNSKFVVHNKILYKNNGDEVTPDYEILECFEGRGGDIVGGSPTVGIYENDLLSPITSIAEDAFSNCTYITDVNLKSTNITKIPAGCFEGCKRLNEVQVPDNIEEIHDRAFTDLGDVPLKLYVENKRCTIASGAFDGKTNVIIYGKKYENEATGEESACYKSWKQIIDALLKDGTHDREYWENKVQFVDRGNEYIATFVDMNLKTIDYVKLNTTNPVDGRDPKDALIAKEIPAAPEYTGLEFVTWMCRVVSQNDDGYEVLTGTKAGDPAFCNIKEDRMFIPNYKFNPSKIVSCGGKHRLNVVGAEYILLTDTGEMIRDFTNSMEVDCAANITLMADTRNHTGKFLCWTVTCTNDEGDFTYLLTNAAGETTGFQMPHLEQENSVVTITAMYSDSASKCEVEVINGSGSGFYNGGDSVEVSAYSPTNPRQTFDKWSVDNTRVSFVDAASATTTFVMPQLEVGQKVVVTASYKDFDPLEGEYELEVINGSGSGFYNVGDVVTISAYASSVENEVFDRWTTISTQAGFADASNATTTIVMPLLNEGEKITVTATYKAASGGNAGDNNPGNGDSNDDNKTKHKVTVNYGSGSGEYEAGAIVNISAYAPESSSRVFSKWTTNNAGLGFANVGAATTSFVMPAADVTVTANYKVRSDDDDDDDDSPSRRPGTSTSTTTVSNRPSSSGTTSTTGTTGTVTNRPGTTDNNGNKIYITKNGVSNKDVASITVDGSTDNFTVRITESAEATAAVEESLINRYGSLDGLAYFPMDISLYDASGQNKITDTYGLNITVTMPIPDVLIQYGGNARVAACDNGNLQQLTPRFTTIDGIACISFVPPHFSPYAIYVDTNNLVAGQTLDQTPSTGDPIHPKWFLATGMACLSIILFATSDSRKKRSYKTA